MKTTLKCTVLALLLMFLGASPRASAIREASLDDTFPSTRVSRMIEVTVNCFTIPYTREQIATRWDLLMALDVDRLAEKNIPAGIFERALVNVQYYADEDSPTSTACFYHASVLTIHY